MLEGEVSALEEWRAGRRFRRRVGKIATVLTAVGAFYVAAHFVIKFW